MVRPRLRDVVVEAAAFMMGAVAALFGLGPALFADGASSERIAVLGASVAFYFVVGIGLGLVAPGVWKASAGCLVVPAFPVAAIFADEAASQLAAAAFLGVFLLGNTAAAFSGALLGARLRLQRQ